MLVDTNMGESSACLKQPFCYSSAISNESYKIDPMKALEESVSFGRFVTESLEWEKWSTFSHNRYVEEAVRISKPGSVAEKKAFFEAHFKKLAAQRVAALIEKAKSDSFKKQEHDEIEVVNTTNSRLTSRTENKVDRAQLEIEDVDNDDTHKDLSEKVSGKNPIDTPNLNLILWISDFDRKRSPEFMESAARHRDQMSKIGRCRAAASDNKDSNFAPEDLQTMDKSTDRIISAEDTATPMNNNPSLRNKRSNAKSLNMSVKFAVIRQIKRLTASVMRKFETTRVGSGSSTASKDRWTPQTTPTKASENELQKHPSFSPLTEQKRNNMKSPTISSSLSLKTEESPRDASRNKERAHKKTSKPRLCFCFKPSSLPEFNNEEEDSKRGTTEDSPTHGRKVTSCEVQRKGSSSPERLTTYENTPPNIQH